MRHDPKDSTSADLTVPDFEAMLTVYPGKPSAFRVNTAWTACRMRLRRCGPKAAR